MCPDCGKPNRTLASWCRSCGRPVGNAADRISGSIPLKPPAISVVPDTFLCAPAAYRGMLYMVSTGGTLYQMSPFDRYAHPLVTFGDGFGRTPCIVRTLSGEREPYVLAAGPTGIKAYSLVTGRVLDLVSGERLVGDHGQNYSGFDVVGNIVYYVASEGKSLVLKAHGRDLRELVADQAVVGPFAAGPNAVAYTSTNLLIMTPQGVRSHAFIGNFKARVLPGEDHRAVGPFGRPPCVVNHEALYIPGKSGKLDSFIVQTMRAGQGEMAVVPVDEEWHYGPSGDGELLAGFTEGILKFDGAARHHVQHDPQGVALAPPWSEPGLNAGFAEGPAGPRVRLYRPGQNPYDTPVEHLSGFLAGMGFHRTGSALVMSYSTADQQLGIASWYD